MTLSPHDPSAKTTNTSFLAKPDDGTMLGFGFAWELGYMIAIPAVLFGIGGGALDSRYHTKPLFTLCGLLLAFIVSTIAVTARVRDILNRFPKVPPKKPELPDPAAVEADTFHDQFRPRS